MTPFGYFLSCEERGSAGLVRQARLAEQAAYVEAGFDEVYIG